MEDGFRHAVDSLLMAVHIYRNLHLETWSVKDRGIVIDHPATICLSCCEFRVQPAGRERVLREKRKNVHAYVKGSVAESPTELTGWIPVVYNPYKGPDFVRLDTLEPIKVADRVFFRDDGKVFAKAS